VQFITIIEIVVLGMLFTVGALQEARHLESLTESSVWLQLRTGSWILDHHSVPRLGLFSRFDELSWADSNWGSQILLAVLYRMIGLRAIPVMQMVLRTLVAMSVFLLAGGRRGGFWWAIALSLCAQIAMFNSSTNSLLLNAVLLSVELWALFASRAKGRQGLLLWMPLLMLAWANLDWHFVFGLFVLLLFLGATLVQQICGDKAYANVRSPVPSARIAMIAAASCVASLLSPSSYYSYAAAWQNWLGEVELTLIPEMKPMNFRTPEHFLLMLLTMLAFLAIGRQQTKDPFKLVLLAVSACIGFAFQSETWITAVVSVAVLGDVFFAANDGPDELSYSSKSALWAVPAIVLIIFVLSASRIPSSTDALLEVTARKLPVRACNFIRLNHLPAPIFNELPWGDFLIWYLPGYPVSIDSRHDLYGEETLKSYYQVATGRRLSSEYPALSAANTFILSTENGLVRIPQMYPNPQAIFQQAFPGFHEVYRDNLAVVLTKQK
jgi:hypothetical protein